MISPLVRRPDWPERLVEFIEGRRVRPFCWGVNDCCLFAADGVLDMTDVDLAEGLRGYTTARQASARVRKAGGMEALASALTPKSSGFASRGDVVLVTLDERETFGLVCGNGHWCGPGAEGLVFRPMSEVVKVFGV